MVKNIRITESSMGDSIKTLTEDEKQIKELSRRSITAKMNIPKGVPITKDKIKIVRPGFGMRPKFINLVVGKIANTDINKNQSILWELIC